MGCTASRRGGGIWYRLSASGRCDTFQRGAGGTIAACVGLVSWTMEWVKTSGKAPVKPCALFCGVGGINLHGQRKTRCKRLYGAVLWQGKIKALHLQQMQGKRKTRPFLTGWNVFYLDALNSAEKNQKKNRTQDNIILCSPPPKP